MIFFFKKRPVVVDLFTNRPDVYNYSKPREASRYFPDWWKALPKQFTEHNGLPASTMKTCVGFNELYSRGFIVPMWSDLVIRVEPDKTVSWMFADGMTHTSNHITDQGGALFLMGDMTNLKVINPWLATTKENVSWMLLNPSWNQAFQTDWVAPSAILQLSRRSVFNINIFVLGMSTPRTFQIDLGKPFLHMVPLFDRPVKLRHHLIDDWEYKKLNGTNGRLAFVNSDKKKKQLEQFN